MRATRPTRRAEDPRRVVFLHVPRTAGTTLKSVLVRQFPASQTVDLGPQGHVVLEDMAGWNTDERANIRLLHGHMAFGAHELLPAPVTYLTILREPVGRVVSFFHFVAGREDHYNFPFVREQATSPAAFATSGVTPATDNFAVRQIAGVWHEVPFGQMGDEHLELAKERLDRHFAVVGTHERFDEFLLLCALEFGWRDVFYVPLNATAHPAVDPAEAAVIAELNHLDMALHQFAAERLAQRVASRGPAFRAAAAAFRAVNPTAARVLGRARDARALGYGPPASRRTGRNSADMRVTP